MPIYINLSKLIYIIPEKLTFLITEFKPVFLNSLEYFLDVLGRLLPNFAFYEYIVQICNGKI